MRLLLPLPALCLAVLPAAAVEEQPIEDLPAEPAQTMPVELPPDIRSDVRSFLDVLGTQAAATPAPAAESPAEPAPDAESSTEVAEPVPAVESRAESADAEEPPTVEMLVDPVLSIPDMTVSEPAVRGDDVAATEPTAVAEAPAMPPQTIADLAAAYPAIPVVAGTPVINILAAPNGLTWQGLEVEEEDLFERIGIFGRSEPGADLRIQAFPDTPVELVKRIVAAAGKAGFTRVSVLLPAPLRPVP